MSVAQNTVELFGTPSVVASPTLNMNVFCGAEHEWSAHPKNNYVVHVSDAMKTGIEDGVAMELLVRPYFEGTVPGSWCTVFGSEGADLSVAVPSVLNTTSSRSASPISTLNLSIISATLVPS